jgi:hypothetical protein
VRFPIETSATTGRPSEDGIAIARGLVPASFGPPSGWPSRRGDQVTDGAVAVPALVPFERDGAERSRRGVEIGQAREEVDPHEPMPGAAARLGIEEVVGEHRRVGR